MDTLIYLNETKAGSGEVGEILLAKFLLSFLQCENLPKYVICVNEAVMLTTKREKASFNALKELSGVGVKVLSCGTCLEAYKLSDKLAIGEVTNAVQIATLLSTHQEIKL